MCVEQRDFWEGRVDALEDYLRAEHPGKARTKAKRKRGEKP